MTNVREIQSRDVESVVGLMEEMCSKTQHPARVDKSFAASSVLEMLDRKVMSGYVLERDQNISGALVGSVSPDWLNGEVTASVMFWYSKPEENGGLLLLRAFVESARKSGARKLFAAVPLGLNERRLNRIFEVSKLKPLETWWFKDLD